MDVRKEDRPGIGPKHRPESRTKREWAVESLRRAELRLGRRGEPLWVAADGADAEQELLKPAIAPGMTVVSRSRCGASLGPLPPVVPGGRRGPGRPRADGTERISPAERAGQRRGRTAEGFTRYGGR